MSIPYGRCCCGAVPPARRMAAGAACRPDGLGLLRAMSHDLLGTLAGWQRAYGDVVHVRVWPEHAVVVTDPALVRELLVTHHDALGRWSGPSACLRRSTAIAC